MLFSQWKNKSNTIIFCCIIGVFVVIFTSASFDLSSLKANNLKKPSIRFTSSNWQQRRIGSDNDMAPHKRRAI